MSYAHLFPWNCGGLRAFSETYRVHDEFGVVDCQRWLVVGLSWMVLIDEFHLGEAISGVRWLYWALRLSNLVLWQRKKPLCRDVQSVSSISFKSRHSPLTDVWFARTDVAHRYQRPLLCVRLVPWCVQPDCQTRGILEGFELDPSLVASFTRKPRAARCHRTLLWVLTGNTEAMLPQSRPFEIEACRPPPSL